MAGSLINRTTGTANIAPQQGEQTHISEHRIKQIDKENKKRQICLNCPKKKARCGTCRYYEQKKNDEEVTDGK